MRLVIGILLVFLATACQTPAGVVLHNQKLSLNELREVLVAHAGKFRWASEDSRQFKSQYFGRKEGALFDPNTSKERLYTVYWILGDRRPYDVRIQVISERKTAKGYAEYGEDLGLEQKFAKQIQDRINQSLENRNPIDDFRPF